LFNSPYYQCTANYYVSNSGNDSANGSSGAPWATLQHADDMKVGAGSCINVAPGTYDGVLIAHGGNVATATGYVVYRCQQLDACKVNGNGGVNGSSAFDTVRNTNGTPPNYVQIDGFEMIGQGTFYAQGVEVWNGDDSAKVSAHHIWILNSIIHGFGQSGLQLNTSEYFYAIHNTLYGNSNLQCDAQGSGISIAGAHTVVGYTPTPDDMANPNPLLGPTWEKGDGTFFHDVVEYNVTYNNALTQCNTANSPGDTDGNGIIFDSNAGYAGNADNYTSPMLAAFNVTYNNGGGGVHVNYSLNVTVANNTCYNNWLDPANNGTGRACIDDQFGGGGTYINNIAVGIPAASSNCNVSPPYTKFNNAIVGGETSGQATDTFSNNLTDDIGVGCESEVGMYQADTYPAASNFESTSPGWVNVGTSSTGTESTSPVGTNFALAPGSKAIGAGLTKPYLPPSSVDIGACASSLTTCP
jgi:hypothetical protein